MRKKWKTVREIVLLITVLGLLTGSFSPMVISQLTKSSLLTGKILTEKKAGMAPGYNLQYTLSFSEKDFSFDKSLGYDLVTMKDCSYLNEIGNPVLPIKNILIALPSGMKATQIRILSTQEQPIQGTYTIFPTQRPQPVGGTPDVIPFAPLNKATYTSLLPYPSQLVSLGAQTDLAGQGMIEITVFPLHYIPLQKKLTLIQSISIIIEGTAGYVCGDYLPQTISENGYTTYEQMIKDMVINPENVELRTSTNPQPMGVGPGDYDYVIITQDSWISEFQPLADWKTRKGIPANIVTTTWIYNNGGYSGSDVNKIRAFVQDVYTNWGTTFVLLGGDVVVVPCHYKTFSSVDLDPVPNDAYYADFDADYVCEVNVGRASVTGPGNGTGQIGNFIYKVLTYETNPPLTNYTKKAGFFGFDLDSWTQAEQCKINIKNAYISTSWTVTTVYDSNGGNHRTNVINALNAGQHIVNHADHSNNDCMGTGYINHNWLIYSSDMDALTNGNKQTILYSIGCDPAAYDVSNCIAEHFVRNSNGGGIAFIGNSRYGWYQYGTYDTLSMGYDVHFFKSLFQENLYNLGVAFSDHKNDGYQDNPGDDYYKYIFTELTLLGDPELPIWTKNPMSMTITHPSQLLVSPSSFTVIVTSGDSPVSQAYVCLWKGTEIYQRGSTDATGNVTFAISPLTGGIMNVTVTKHNYLPNESTVQVKGNNQPPYQPSSPTPTNGATNVPIAANLSWTCGDPNQGDIVTYVVYFGISSNPPMMTNNQSTTTYDPGTLNQLTTYYWKIKAWDNHGASTIGPVWVFTTQSTTNHPPNQPKKPTGPTTRLIGQQGTYWANGTDPDSDKIQYRFDWNASGSHTYSGWTSLVNSGTKLSKNHSWTKAGTYVVKVQARDEHGAVSIWSNGLTVTVTVNHPPNKSKKPTGPTSRLVGQQGTYWANGTDPDSDKIQYRFDWNASGSHTYSAWTSLVKSGTKLSKLHSWSKPGTYVVKVQARDEHGATSVWSTGLTVIVHT